MSQETDDLRKRLVDLYTTPEDKPKAADTRPLHVQSRKVPPNRDRAEYRAGLRRQQDLLRKGGLLE